MDRIERLDWIVVPGEAQTMILRFWLDKAKTVPDTDVGTSVFLATVRRNPRDTGTPLAVVDITVTDVNEITLELTAEQTMDFVGCKEAMWALQRDGTTIIDGRVPLEYTVVQAGP